VLALLAACQPGPSQATAAGPDAGARGGAIVVASFNFPESELLAAIYGLAIRHAGIPVQFELDLGPRELVQPALEQGLVDMVPEYLGTALTSLGADRGVPMADPAPVRAALARALARWHIQVMTPTAAQDQNGIVVTGATARRLGLRAVSDLRRVAGRLTLGGSPECPDRPYCLPGLRTAYGLAFARFLPFDTEAQRVTALRDASVQPSRPPTENAGTPDPASRCASETSPSTLAGGATPSFSKTPSLYQIRDLLAALNQTP